MGEELKKTPEADTAAPSAGKLKIVALSRCRYSDTAGKVHDAEPGDVIESPCETDLKDLEEAKIIEAFDADAIAAVKSLVGKNTKALRAILGL